MKVLIRQLDFNNLNCYTDINALESNNKKLMKVEYENEFHS